MSGNGKPRTLIAIARAVTVAFSLGILSIIAVISFIVGVFIIFSVHDSHVNKGYSSLEQEIRDALPRYSSYEDVTNYLRKRGLRVSWSEKDRQIEAGRKLEFFLCAHIYSVTIPVDEHKRLLDIKFFNWQYCL